MEYSQIALNNGLTFLAWATGFIVLVVGGFLVKLLIDLSALSKNLNETSILINTELKPTLQEINETLHSVNELIKNTDKNVDNFKSAIERTLGKTKMLSDSLFGGVAKGFVTIMSLFSMSKK